MAENTTQNPPPAQLAPGNLDRILPRVEALRKFLDALAKCLAAGAISAETGSAIMDAVSKEGGAAPVATPAAAPTPPNPATPPDAAPAEVPLL